MTTNSTDRFAGLHETNDEFVYCRVCKGEEGLTASGWWDEQSFTESDLLNYAVVGIKVVCLLRYLSNRAEDNPKVELRGWFLVKLHDSLSYDDIHEAIKYG